MSKKAVRAVNTNLSRMNELDEAEKKRIAALATRVSCPFCNHSLTIARALKNGVEWGKHDDTDFECPDCKEPLLLCKAVFGGTLYFGKGRREIDRGFKSEY